MVFPNSQKGSNGAQPLRTPACLAPQRTHAVVSPQAGVPFGVWTQRLPSVSLGKENVFFKLGSQAKRGNTRRGLEGKGKREARRTPSHRPRAVPLSQGAGRPPPPHHGPSPPLGVVHMQFREHGFEIRKRQVQIRVSLPVTSGAFPRCLSSLVGWGQCPRLLGVGWGMECRPCQSRDGSLPRVGPSHTTAVITLRVFVILGKTHQKGSPPPAG